VQNRSIIEIKHKKRCNLLDVIDVTDVVEGDEITCDVARLIRGMFRPVIYRNCLDVKERVGGRGSVTII
jgi:hypothetical protein